MLGCGAGVKEIITAVRRQSAAVMHIYQ